MHSVHNSTKTAPGRLLKARFHAVQAVRWVIPATPQEHPEHGYVTVKTSRVLESAVLILSLKQAKAFDCNVQIQPVRRIAQIDRAQGLNSFDAVHQGVAVDVQGLGCFDQ